MSYTSAFTVISNPGRPSVSKRLSALVPAPMPLAARIAGWLREAIRRQQSRHAIARLDPRMLSDIGVSWAEAEAEANKPWWRS